MKRFLVCMAAVCAAWVSVEAKPAATNAPAEAVATNVPPVATQAVAVAAAEVLPPAPAPEWAGYVRVLRGDQGEVRAIRLVVDDKLVAVELNEKGRELAAFPKTRKMLVKGALEVRDSRAWLVVSEFKEAPEIVPETPAPPAAAPAPAATNVPPVETTNTAPAAVSNAAPAAAPVP